MGGLPSGQQWHGFVNEPRMFRSLFTVVINAMFPVMDGIVINYVSISILIGRQRDGSRTIYLPISSPNVNDIQDCSATSSARTGLERSDMQLTK